MVLGDGVEFLKRMAFRAGNIGIEDDPFQSELPIDIERGDVGKMFIKPGQGNFRYEVRNLGVLAATKE
jgi:hypothetical protein